MCSAVTIYLLLLANSWPECGGSIWSEMIPATNMVALVYRERCRDVESEHS